MNEIYKINYVKNNKTEKIVVFIGEKIKYNSLNLKELLMKDPDNNIIKELLTEEELYDIKTHNIDVDFVLNYIHLDDTIECIKFKIIEAFGFTFSFEEMYLFCKKIENLNSTNIFQKLTRNGKLDLTKDRLISFLLNYEGINFDVLPDKELYTFDDILLLNLDKTYIVNTFIGQHLTTMEKFYTANPYNVLSVDRELDEKIDSILTTTNKNLLLNYGNINNNTLYLCLADDVIENALSKQFSPILMIKQYFYFLDKLQIYDLEELKKQNTNLIEKSKIKIEKEYSLYNKKINLFHTIFHEKKKNLKYIKDGTGIDSIELILNAKIIFNMPLDMLFKFLNSHKNIPLVKYNPGLKRENIYRLFSPHKDINNNKIPLISKSRLIKIDRDLAKRKRIGFYIIDNNETTGAEILCEIDNKGNIFINIKFEKYVNLSKIEYLIKKNINPILKLIKNEFDTNGHIIDLFSSFDDKNVELLTLNYNSILELNNTINFTKYSSCMGSTFDIFEKNLKKGIHLSFKRVSNYNKMEGEEAFIFDLLTKRYTDDEIIDEVKTNYSIPVEEAKLLFANVISNLQILRNLDDSRKIKIKSCPGFKVNIDAIKFKNQVKVTISNINNVLYLKTIPIYIDSIIRLNEKVISTNISIETINKICKIKVNEIEGVVDDKVSVVEKPYPEMVALTEVNLDDDDDDDILDLMLGDDSDEEDEEYEKAEDDKVIGGSSSSSKSKSNSKSENSLSSLSGSWNIEDSGDEAQEEDKSKSKKSPDDEEIEQVNEYKDDDDSDDEKLEEYVTESLNLFSKPPPKEPVNIHYKKEKSDETIIEEKLVSIANLDLHQESELLPESLELVDINQKHTLFCYGSNNINQVRYRINNPKLTANKGLLLDHIRIFAGESKIWNNGGVASLKEKDGQNCRGSYVIINEQELNMIKRYEGELYNIKPVVIEDEKKNKLKGIAFFKKDNTWVNHPSLEYIKAVVENVYLFWKDLDENNELLIKDEYGVLKGIYKNDDKTYIKIEDSPNDPEDDEEISLDVTGQALTYPNPIARRLQDREPALFYAKDKKNPLYQGFSRMCEWNIKRQPIILTQKEKEKIDKKHPGSYGEVLTYGSDPKNQYHYVCPRYWSLKYNTTLTEEEVASGKYGNVIPEDATVVPENASIIEFTSHNHMKNGKYKSHFPGFLKKPGKNGVCIPCCFATKNKAFIERKQQCHQDPNSKNTNVSDTIKKPSKFLRRVSSDVNEIILGPDKFPIESNRWGYLPSSIQYFLDTDNKLCQKNERNTALKVNNPCLIRKGMEINKKQSFVACLADLYVYKAEPVVEFIPTIEEMRNIIADSLTLDQFVKLNNGNMVNIFSENREIDIKKYTKTIFYKNVIKKNPSQVIKAAESFENFISFLKDEDSVIDYTYLWDLISNENNIFKNKSVNNGINLVILEVVNNDITENVNIICPINRFSTSFFDDNKLTFIVIKIENYYEPIYIVTDKQKYLKEEKLIDFKNKKILPELKTSLSFIKKNLQSCKPIQDNPLSYKFKSNISAKEIHDIVTSYNYTVNKQIINYNNKVIGLEVQKEKHQGYVPCYPTAINSAFEYVHIEEYENWTTYKKTVDFLVKLHINCNAKINCLPILKVVEDELVVAIITQTNQLIPLIAPEENIVNDNLDVIKKKNFLIADKISNLGLNQDVDRIEFVKKVKMEKQFFETFRLAIKQFITQYKNINVMHSIESVVENEQLTYKTKLVKIKEILNELIKDKIEFTNYNLESLIQVNEVTNCFLDDLDCDKKPFCVKTDEESCKFIIPDKNLINGKNNKKLYLLRVSDEFIRFNRIKTLFNPNTITIFKEQKYNINDDEILLLQSLLGGYYDKLLLKNKNKRSKQFDEVNPITNKVYGVLQEEKEEGSEEKEDIVEEKLDTVGEKQEETLKIDCIKDEKLLTGGWKKIFPIHSKEISYNELPNCSFEILIHILKEFNPLEYRDIDKKQIKDLLVESYQKYNDIISNILKLLIHEGKSRKIITNISKKNTTIQAFVTSEDYYITNLDIVVLSGYLNIPLVLYSSSINKDNKLLTLNLLDDYFFGIKMTYRLRDHKYSSFKLLKTKTSKLSFKEIKPETVALFREKNITVENYVKQQLSLIKTSVKVISTN